MNLYQIFLMGEDLFSEDETPRSKEVLRKRAFASMIDYLTLLLFTFFLPLIIGEKTSTGYKVEGILALLPILYWIAYFIVAEKIFFGTLGKNLLGIRVESSNGGSVTYSQVIKRRLADFIEIIWCFGLVAYVRALSNTHNKRPGDVWGNTRVVNKK